MCICESVIDCGGGEGSGGGCQSLENKGAQQWRCPGAQGCRRIRGYFAKPRPKTGSNSSG